VAAAGQIEQVKITGRITIEPAEVPTHITAEAIAEAGHRRVENVLVVLEHSRAELEKRLSTQSDAIASSTSAITAQLTFEADKPNFDVVFEVQRNNGEHFPHHKWRQQLPKLVEETISDFITETATSVGLWKVAVFTDLEDETDNIHGDKTVRANNDTGTNMPYGVVLAGGLVLAAGVLAMLLLF